MIRTKDRFWPRAGGVVALAAMAAMAPASASSADEAALRAQTPAFVKAYNSGDVKGVVAQYADDAVVQAPGVPAARGKAAILAYFAQDIATSVAAGIGFVVDAKTDAGIAGDLGWESGTYQVTVKGKVIDSGNFLSVSRKQNGRWLYIRDIWNSDLPPPAPPAAPAPVAK